MTSTGDQEPGHQAETEGEEPGKEKNEAATEELGNGSAFAAREPRHSLAQRQECSAD